MKKTLILLTSILILVIFGSCASFSPEQFDVPGKYPSEFRPWPNDDDDVLEYAKFNSEIDLSLYSKLVILPINQSKVTFDQILDEGEKPDDEEKEDDSDDIAREVLYQIDDIFYESIMPLEELILMPMERTESYSGTERVLLLETDVLIVNPGSKSLRYFVSFGAGATQVMMEGRIVDSSTGDVLISFIGKDYGISGSWGGDSEDLLIENIEEIASYQFGSILYSYLYK